MNMLHEETSFPKPLNDSNIYCFVPRCIQMIVDVSNVHREFWLLRVLLTIKVKINSINCVTLGDLACYLFPRVCA